MPSRSTDAIFLSRDDRLEVSLMQTPLFNGTCDTFRMCVVQSECKMSFSKEETDDYEFLLSLLIPDMIMMCNWRSKTGQRRDVSLQTTNAPLKTIYCSIFHFSICPCTHIPQRWCNLDSSFHKILGSHHVLSDSFFTDSYRRDIPVDVYTICKCTHNKTCK